MKQAFTSNYARNGKHPNAICISVVRPRWYPNMVHMPELGPTWDMVKAYKTNSDIQQYTKDFWSLLLVERKIDPVVIAKNIPEDAILLCWEKPSDFCHRQLVREWLNSTNEIYISELIKPKEQVWSSEIKNSNKVMDLFD